MPYLGVVFFEEENDPEVVLECDDVGFGEALEWGHVGLGSLEGAEDVLGEADRVELQLSEDQLGVPGVDAWQAVP